MTEIAAVVDGAKVTWARSARMLMSLPCRRRVRSNEPLQSDCKAEQDKPT